MKTPPRISPAEREVLAVLWKSAPLGTAEIVETLATSKGWSRGTTRTLLARLVRKKAIGCRLEGHRHWYRPLIAEEASVRHESRSFLQRVFSGASGDMLLTLVEETQLTPDQIQKLRAILDRKGK
ncbi:MAG: BlaI/MecI/CopY family transcriptional regulator [Limisphaerales bacterium]